MSTADIKGLSRLRILELVGCKRLQMLPDLPPGIEEIFADDCTLMQSDIAMLSKYEMLFTISFTNCVQLLENQQVSSTVDALWEHLLKGLSTTDDKFSICIPGNYIPSWFTYQNMGSSISVELPPDWCNPEFMGFALCAVSEYVAINHVVTEAYLKKMSGIRFQFKVIARDGIEFSFVSTFCNIGADGNLDLQHVCLAYVPFVVVWSAYAKKVFSPSEWCKIKASSGDLSRETIFKAWGIRLLYKQDVERKNESSESRKFGLSNAIFKGSYYAVKGRRRDYIVPRLPPEVTSDDSENEIVMFNFNQPRIHNPCTIVHLAGEGQVAFQFKLPLFPDVWEKFELFN